MPKNHDNIDILGQKCQKTMIILTFWAKSAKKTMIILTFWAAVRRSLAVERLWIYCGVTVRGALVKLPILEKNVKTPWVFASFFSPVIDPPVESFFFSFFFLSLKKLKQN